MTKKRDKNKRAMSSLKAYFLIVNMIVATIAFSWMVSAPDSDLPGTKQLVLSEGDATAKAAKVANPPPALLDPNTGGAGAAEAAKAIQLSTSSNVFNIPSNINLYAPGSTTRLTQLIKASDGTYHMVGANGAIGDAVTIPQGVDPSTFTSAAGPAAPASTGPLSFLNNGIIQSAMYIGLFTGLGYLVGSFIGGNGKMAGAMAGLVGSATYQILKYPARFGLESVIGKTGVISQSPLGLPAMGWGVIAAAVIFVMLYKKTSTEIVEFNCQPWEAPIGGADCEKCNTIENGCSEYRCKSLGQACGIVNAGTTEEKCVWINPHDVNSPMIKIGSLLKSYIWKPDTAVRPPATGVVISKEDGSCIEAFTALEFTLQTDEASQCKVDYNLTRSFDEMNYFVGGSNIFSYNHTETMSLPGPDAINKIAPELKNDGTYTLYVRCQDANGNFNQDAFSVRFCVKPGPDTTPPRIEAVNIPSNSPILYNTTNLNIEVYVNEPSECKWSKEDRTFDNMENTMACSTNLWEMNNNNVYTCKTTLTGIKDRSENDFYFRCKDQPGADESDRNVNTQSYKYTIIGTQPLNILSVGPNETIRGSTDTVPVELTVKTDNGYDNGKAICYYSTTGIEKDYIQFFYDGTEMTNEHKQRQDLVTGSYKYYFKCVDLGGNAAYDSTSFSVEVDRSSPTVVRAYKEGGLKIITSEKSICSYSNKDCNFEIKDGIAMPNDNEEIHNAEWKMQNYYIRCKDEYDNQPNPNTCSIVVKPYNLGENVIEL